MLTEYDPILVEELLETILKEDEFLRSGHDRGHMSDALGEASARIVKASLRFAATVHGCAHFLRQLVSCENGGHEVHCRLCAERVIENPGKNRWEVFPCRHLECEPIVEDRGGDYAVVVGSKCVDCERAFPKKVPCRHEARVTRFSDDGGTNFRAMGRECLACGDFA
jgi:hypothetical protein